MITRLIYFSENHTNNGLNDIREILKSARRNNNNHKISGILYHNENFFMQVLEGNREDVSFLFQKITNDSRHENIVIVSVDEAEDRIFKDWGMLYVNESAIPEEELITYLKGSKFNPNTMPSDQLKQMALGIKSKYASSLDEVE